MIEIKGLAQGADYMLEFPFTLDGVAITAATAVEFDITKDGVSVLKKNLCNGVTITAGLVSVPLTNANTLNLAGYYDFELWIIPINDPAKKHHIESGRIHFSKTNTRVIPCL